MAIFNATDFKATISGAPEKTIADTTDISIDYNVNPIDVSTKDSQGFAENIGGQRSWSGSISGKVDFDPGANEQNVAELISLATARTHIDIVGKNGEKSFSGKAILTKVGFATPMEDAPTYTLDFVGSGPLTVADVV